MLKPFNPGGKKNPLDVFVAAQESKLQRKCCGHKGKSKFLCSFTVGNAT